MKLPTPLNTTKLAEYQDLVLSRTDWSHDEAMVHLRKLADWVPMVSRLPVSNLTLRHTLITGGLNRLSGLPVGSFDPAAHAEKMFDQLRRNGYWLEGPSYREYVEMAVMWYYTIVGGNGESYMDIALRDMYMNERELVAPDGTIPIPEASARKYSVGILPDYVSTPSYIVKRRASGAYLLVCVDPETEPRGNFHFKAAAGYFALWCNTGPGYLVNKKRFADEKEYKRWMKGRTPLGDYRLSEEAKNGEHSIIEIPSRFEWAVRCTPYDHWRPEDVPTDAGLQDLLPPGALTPLWRLKPPRITVKYIDQGVKIRWDNSGFFDATRVITWRDGVVRCVDRWLGVRKRVREWKVA